LPTTRHRCNLDCMGLGAKPRRWASLNRDSRKGSEYNENSNFFFVTDYMMNVRYFLLYPGSF